MPSAGQPCTGQLYQHALSACLAGLRVSPNDNSPKCNSCNKAISFSRRDARAPRPCNNSCKISAVCTGGRNHVGDSGGGRAVYADRIGSRFVCSLLRGGRGFALQTSLDAAANPVMLTWQISPRKGSSLNVSVSGNHFERYRSAFSGRGRRRIADDAVPQ